MFIVHVASEFAPIAKVGGLADVLLGLCRELTWKGHDVEIILPFYDCMDRSKIEDLTQEEQTFTTHWDNQKCTNRVWHGKVEGLTVTFIDPQTQDKFFERGQYYGYPDDPYRFAYFSRSVLEYLQQRNKHPDVLHIHDWQQGLIPVLNKKVFAESGLKIGRILMTIHNIDYQGWCEEGVFNKAGAPIQPEFLQNDSYNMLKAGIIYCNILTTVSPNYSYEVQTPEGGKGLDELLRQYRSKFYGILNGIDYSYWNPSIDRYLPENYCLEGQNIEDIRLTKTRIKNMLQKRMGLTVGNHPLVGAVTRLVPQKGIEQIKQALFRTVEKGGQFLLLGSSPLPEIQIEFEQLQIRFKDNPNVHIELSYNEDLSHLFFAAGDILVVPSLFEPCGLTQLIALKYGTIPIVRKTGGLADTINDVDFSRKEIEERNGYVFENPDENGIYSALDRAMHCYYDDFQKWQDLVDRALKLNFSWTNPANLYLELYSKEI
ncbi:MAG: glycogen synthase [Parachlamydiales bacterium]|nr:glycogen synthase [Parachlamydiales bacterium]